MCVIISGWLKILVIKLRYIYIKDEWMGITYNMIIEYKTYGHDDDVQEISSGDVLRYCDLKNISLDGGEFDNTFLSCEIEFCDLYWVLFNNCLFVDVRFCDCKFSGVSFISCRFINCDFVNCEFTQDNFNQLCSFTETIWFGCKVEHSNGLPDGV
ncbi:pentapeptide repeat-containing protein [Hafnia alvei]|uniref:Pentapeptide repeat protein n=2 Tax=Hafnia alvei TaxID=569 RepID=G9YC25_HAFAL|nr:hypothetical protein HMPREF0454_04151 [Hafnia alvei ATCC 51873]